VQRIVWYAPTENPLDPAEDKALRAGVLLQETAAIEQRQSSWHELNLWNSTLYTNRVLPGFRWGELEADEELWPTNLRTENLVEEIGEAFLSKAASSPLKPTLVPHGNSWKVERAVRLLDNFLFGTWRQTAAEDACTLMFRDAYMSGLGWTRVAFDAGKLHVESVFFDNVIIDNRECVNRAPPRTYRLRQCLPRADIEERYDVRLDKYDYHPQRPTADGWAIIVEVWRLPNAFGIGGRHCVASCGQMLVDEEWKHPWVPLVPFHWVDRTSGYFTKGGVEQCVPYQVIQNELNDAIKASMDIRCRPRLLVHANSMIDVSQWDNQAGRFLMWSGTQPEPFVWETELAELLGERDRNRERAFGAVGTSEMFASAEIPNQVRLDSSAGVREFRNMEDARHLRLWTNFENARLQVARTILNVLATSKGADAFKAVYHPPGARAQAKTIEWEAVKTLTTEQYSWTLEATPLSMMSPAARREALRDNASRGQGDTDESKRIIGAVNLEWIEELEMAAADDILRHISIMEDGDFEAPTELTNTTLGVRKVTANYHRLRAYDDVPAKILENHIAWIVKAVAIQQAAIAPPQPVPFAPTQGMPGTSAAMGQPMMNAATAGPTPVA